MDTIDLGNDTVVEIIREDHNDIKDIIKQVIERKSETGDDQAFYIADLTDIVNKHQRWEYCLPHVKPFYAVKCNDGKEVLRLLANLGCSFDCASLEEIKKVLQIGVDPLRIIFAHPQKPESHLKFAAENGVMMTVFDTVEELYKTKKIHPKSKLFLRIIPGDFPSDSNFNDKFGCAMENTLHVLEVAKELDLDIVGISFHVGHMCQATEAYTEAISRARTVFDQAVSVGHIPYVIDIGGGYPGTADKRDEFEETCEQIMKASQRFFPKYMNVRFMAEPGTYFVESAYTVVVKVIGKRKSSTSKKPLFEYYLSDGCNGAFALLKHPAKSSLACNPLPLKGFSGERYQTTLWGPTLDPFDFIRKDILLPELDIGDYLIVENMGGYSKSLATTFNGFQISKVHPIIRQESVLKDEINGLLPNGFSVTSIEANEI